MKYLIKIATIVLLFSVITSCTTTEKITISGTPGTMIYTPNEKCMGTIPSDGKLKIELPSDGYFGYLLSKEEKSDLFVPFALDHRKCNHIGTKILSKAGYTIMFMGLAIECGGLIAYLVDSESETASALIASGLGAAGVGALMGGPATNRLGQLSYDWNFKYIDDQCTNQDITFTKPILNIAKKKTITKKVSSTNTHKKTVSGKTKKTLKDYAAQIEGTYIGTGNLSLNGKIIERYSKAIIKIERLDNETVCVNIEENGAFFFDECNNYKIKKTKNGYFLTHNSISKAIIKISNNGNIEFFHPEVNLDDTKYSLSLKAKAE